MDKLPYTKQKEVLLMKFNCNFLAKRYFVISILLNFSLFGFSFARADFQHPETLSPFNAYELPVWKIHSPDVEGGTGSNVMRGTGFFIGENHFVTNFHVISHMLRGSGSLENIALLQQGNTSVLRIKEILSVSAAYDLALLETEESVTNYLNLGESPPEPNENLFSIAYPYGVFTVINKTGDILYENNQSYIFPTDNSSMSGASGSPVLDEQGQVVGVLFKGLHNLLHAIKINPLQEFIKGNIGIKCIKSVSIAVRFFNKECIKKEMERLQKLAEEGSIFAQYALADKYDGEDEGIEPNIDKAIKWYEKAANQGYVLAQYSLGVIYHKVVEVLNWHEAIKWYEKAAEGGFIPSQAALASIYVKREKYPEALQLLKQPAERGYADAQSRLAVIYHDGKGVEKDFVKAFYWYERAAMQGEVNAQILLAGMYYRGEGVDPDIGEAIRWYRKAANQGSPVAQMMLQDLLQ